MQGRRVGLARSPRLAAVALVATAGAAGCQNLLGEDFSGYQLSEAPQEQMAWDASPDAENRPDAHDQQVEQPASCSNRLADGDETDVDCGGQSCSRCQPGAECHWAGDCGSSVCMGSVCQTPTCLDFVRNGSETDTDCGGATCNACERDKACLVHEDCATGFCGSGTCAEQGCVNGTLDGSETDVDCGGQACAPCGAAAACKRDRDCRTSTCIDGTCRQPSCTDGRHNGSETWVDCGGVRCPACLDGHACERPRDCRSGVCGAGTCRSVECGDGVLNGTETDVDCGGDTCPGCVAGRNCNANEDCASWNCSSGRCVSCAIVTDSSGMGSYCIDTTEVTQQRYAAFLAAKGGNASGQPAYCAWNTSYAPSTADGGCTAGAYDPVSKGAYPVTCVDWCDALAYCAWAGFRLCGATGGGATPIGSYADASADQWHNACTSQGAKPYPYGSDYLPGACNTAEQGNGAPQSVARAAKCHAPSAPFSLVHDMTGNVWEWENACDGYANKNDSCRLRGGSYATVTPSCDRGQTGRRRAVSVDVGFRCCS